MYRLPALWLFAQSPKQGVRVVVHVQDTLDFGFSEAKGVQLVLPGGWES